VQSHDVVEMSIRTDFDHRQFVDLKLCLIPIHKL
jgi:hypothetical protein